LRCHENKVLLFAINNRKIVIVKNSWLMGMKLVIVLGTRPEIIKMSPIIQDCIAQNHNYTILHTGQHYSWNMDTIFFEQLGLPEPDYNLEVGSGSHGVQTGRMLQGIETVLTIERPDVVLVEGDTNTVLAGALAAAKMNIQVGHVEAGLRSNDQTMPEEINRVLTDHCSDLLFAPTVTSENNLLNEGISKEKIFVTGNTIVDVLYRNKDVIDDTTIISNMGFRPKEYFLVTVHRQENVDNKCRFLSILNGLRELYSNYKLPILYPIHPRSKKMLKAIMGDNNFLNIIEPVDYFSFIQLEKHAKCILTDSGGVQEEACILRVPCITLRDNTERPETIDVGANVLAGVSPTVMLNCVKNMLSGNNIWDNPYGEGVASKNILRILMNTFQ